MICRAFKPFCIVLFEYHVAAVNDRGQDALGCATFRKDEDAVRALLAAGADPDGGSPSAREVARTFGLEEMLTLLDGRG